MELAYNSRNFVTSRIDGEGYTTRRFYDRMGNLTTYYPPVQWEKKESGYEYRHDFLERVVDTISPLQEHHRVFRNFDGDITSRIHPVSYALKGEEEKEPAMSTILTGTASVSFIRTEAWSGDSMMRTAT